VVVSCNDATPKIRAPSQALRIVGLFSHRIPARIECLAGAKSCGPGRSVVRSVVHTMFRLLYDSYSISLDHIPLTW